MKTKPIKALKITIRGNNTPRLLTKKCLEFMKQFAERPEFIVVGGSESEVWIRRSEITVLDIIYK